MSTRPDTDDSAGFGIALDLRRRLAEIADSDPCGLEQQVAIEPGLVPAGDRQVTFFSRSA